MGLILTATKQCLKISVEAGEKAVHFQNVVHRDRIAFWSLFLLKFRLRIEVLFTEAAQRKLGFLGIAVTDHRGDEVPSVTLTA